MDGGVDGSVDSGVDEWCINTVWSDHEARTETGNMEAWKHLDGEVYPHILHKISYFLILYLYLIQETLHHHFSSFKPHSTRNKGLPL